MLRVDDAELPLGGPRPRAVFAQLAIQPNRVVSTETLAMGTWNNDPPPDARANLQVFVHNLRKSMRFGGSRRAFGARHRRALVTAS